MCIRDRPNIILVTLSKPLHPHHKNSGLDYVDVRDTLVIFITARRWPEFLWWTRAVLPRRPEYFSYTKFTIILTHQLGVLAYIIQKSLRVQTYMYQLLPIVVLHNAECHHQQ